MAGRARAWTVTINNPFSWLGGGVLPSDLIRNWNEVVRETCIANNVGYFFWQLESGAEGTRHIQAFVYFTNARSLVGVKKVFPTAHVEVMRGTVEQNEVYCSKSETKVEGPWTFGEKPAQGKRSDLDAVKEMIDSGASELEVANANFPVWCRYERAFRRYRVLTARRVSQTTVTVYWGPSGSGKSYRGLAAGISAYWLPPPNKDNQVWWDGYDGHDTVIIDEFTGWIQRKHLKRLIDRYPYPVPTKGGFVPFTAKEIIMISNKPVEDWYPNVGLGELERRFKPPVGNVVYVGGFDAPEGALDTVDDDGEKVLYVPQTEEEYRSTFFNGSSDNASSSRSNVLAPIGAAVVSNDAMEVASGFQRRI